MWMHLNKPDPTTLSYTPPENNASGFESLDPIAITMVVNGGSLNAIQLKFTTTTLKMKL